MQPVVLNVKTIFEELHETLRWEWCCGHDGGDRVFDADMVSQALSNVDLVGYLNFIHPHQIPVLGQLEVDYFKDKTQETHAELFASFCAIKPPAVVLADGQEPVEPLVGLCKAHAVPLFVTQECAAYVVEVLRSYLSQSFALKASMHGVFMDIFGVGVLLQGESGIGKSELGLDLVSRGHGLVADDVVDFMLIRQGVIEGHCPALLENLLEVRGIGLLDVKTIFGERAVRHKMELQLIVRLLRREIWELEFERLPTKALTQNVLGEAIREVVIPVQAGRNIAVLVEAAVRNTMLQIQGIDTYQEFVKRQRKVMLGRGSKE
jgi:Serine kinase of the HPr protein, regulates carbohydrate metabolism